MSVESSSLAVSPASPQAFGKGLMNREQAFRKQGAFRKQLLLVINEQKTNINGKRKKECE